MEKVSNPLISVVIPVYKVEEYLNRCVDSIIKQTYENLEIILVDDGSPDNCPKICDEYSQKDKRIKVIHKENGGVSSARNRGVEKSTGEWITFVDADDWLESNYCDKMLESAINYKAEYVCCGYNRVFNNYVEKINSNGVIKIFSDEEYLLKLLNVQNGYGFCHMKMIKKSICDKLPFDENLIVGEDALFNVKICKKINKAVVLNEPLYNYFFNDNSVVRKYDVNYVNKYLQSMNLMYQYIEDSYDNSRIIQNMYNYISYHVLLIAVNYCYHPENKQKRKSLKNVCSIDLFKKAIKKSNYQDLSLTRKITLFTIKHKLYFITAIICKIRQHQFK